MAGSLVTVATACLWRVAFRRHEDPPTVTVATACLWRVAFRRHEDPPTVRDFNSEQASVKASCGVGRRQQASGSSECDSGYGLFMACGVPTA
ncbi:hypothetical protein INR49_010359 [Caranx melampygus]|nr:hypothetical protein INR49_010359 [Caranx melampygus]